MGKCFTLAKVYKDQTPDWAGEKTIVQQVILLYEFQKRNDL